MSDGRDFSMTNAMIGPARLEDAAVIVELVRSSFEPSRAPFLTYTQSGMVRHLTAVLRYPTAHPERVIIVARDGEGAFLGFADFLLVGDGVGFLSYVAVIERVRGTGTASSLFAHFLESHPTVSRIELDVFQENLAARQMYESMGFIVQSTSAWITRPLPSAIVVAELQVDRLPNALAAYSAYGFCEMETILFGETARIGLLGPSVLNARSFQNFENDALLAGIRGLFPDLQTAFASLPEQRLANVTTPHLIIGRSERLSLALTGHNSRGLT
jgi:ribosomal protein S18 acetylase RimI-like enzyme